jgi:histidinol-phosphate aminotransferase
MTIVRPEIARLSAYHVPDATGLIKLDAMENPYGWPDDLRDAWLETLRHVSLNRYPDPQGRELQQALREGMAIPPEAAILLGNGSDELIQMLALTVTAPEPGHPTTVLSVDPGFVMYRMIGLFAGLDYVGVPLKSDDFGLDLDAILAAIDAHRPALTFIAYPNNPTGNLFGTAAIEAVIEAAPGLVIVDEAYAPFTDESFLPKLGRWSNLLVMRTVSKMGLAGLRLGYLAGPPEIVEQIDKTRLPYNINVLTQASATFALRHRAVLDEQTAAICRERERLSAALTALDGLTPYPSQANFILARTNPGQAGRVYDALRDHGILIKKLDGAHPLLADCLRITVGTPEENDALLAALGDIVNPG